VERMGRMARMERMYRMRRARVWRLRERERRERERERGGAGQHILISKMAGFIFRGEARESRTLAVS